MTDIFYVVIGADTNLILGVQWLYYTREHTINYKVPEMRFKNASGKEAVLRGINTYRKPIVSAHSMRSILSHGNIEWVVEVLITTQGTTLDISQYQEYMKKLLLKNKKEFGELPHGKPPDYGVKHRIDLEIGT